MPAEDQGGSKDDLAPTDQANPKYQILEDQGFVVGKTIGNGSYACVKAAYDTNKKVKVAIKIISKKKAPEEFIVKFLPREIEIVRTLSHPNLIEFYQAIETTTRFFFVMELSEKGDLLEYLRKKKSVEESLLGTWFKNIYDALAYMHNKGVAHRDLKCENVLISAINTLKVADFGFARTVRKQKGGEVVLSETYCGSFAYAAPEILKGIPYNAFLTEVFGKLPFDDSNHTKLLKQVQTKVVFPQKPNVTESIKTMILRMLSRPSERITLEEIPTEGWFTANCVDTVAS